MNKVHKQGWDDSISPLPHSHTVSMEGIPVKQTYSYLCRYRYIEMVLCYHCHLVCVLSRPVPSLHPFNLSFFFKLLFCDLFDCVIILLMFKTGYSSIGPQYLSMQGWFICIFNRKWCPTEGVLTLRSTAKQIPFH